MNRLLIIGILLNSAVALYAQAQQPNTAKLKADAQKVVSSIRGDKAKTQAYCQINSLGGEIDLAAQARNEQKADELTKKDQRPRETIRSRIPRTVRRAK